MLNRRDFLRNTTVLGTGLSSFASGAGAAPNDKVIVGIMGVNSRGRDVAGTFASVGGCEIAYICDPDQRTLEKAAAYVAQKGQARKPQLVSDFRKVLDDKSVDALVIAAPDHWHAPATIMACNAGKHVYCEKPASHNAREGEMMVAAARKHNRVVQLGTQRRSMPGIREAVEKLQGGIIGRVLFSRGWYNNSRPSIGHGKTAPVPDWLDYSRWQGPAPERPFRDNLVHYNWHWFWHWGTAELGNNGIHALDVCRWGLGVDYPTRVTAGGGKYRWDDDQETPDTHVVTYDFGDKSITWEGRSWSRRGFENNMFGMSFYGDKGSLVIDGGGYRVYDDKDKEVTKVAGAASDAPHVQNFLECVRSGSRPNAEIEEGHKSTLLCHLGNIAYRANRTLKLDPKNGHIFGDKEAAQYWGREYRKGWEPKV